MIKASNVKPYLEGSETWQVNSGRKPGTILFLCRICGNNLEAPKMQIGNRVCCEECDRETVVPGQSTRMPSIRKTTPKYDMEDIPVVLPVEPEKVVPVEPLSPKSGAASKRK